MMKKFVFAVLTAVLIGCTPVYADDTLIGDVNGDSVVNVRDAACIACHLADNSVSELDHETADYNTDDTVNVRDCADIAADLVRQYSDKYEQTIIPKKPDKTNGDVKTYVTDMVKYLTYQKYGITKIHIADHIPDNELYTLSWDVPVEFIANESEYLVKDMPILPAAVQSDCDGVIDALMLRIESMIEEQRTDYVDEGFSDNEIFKFLGEENSFTLYWRTYNSKDNYQIYVIM